MRITLAVDIIPVTKLNNTGHWKLPKELEDSIRKMSVAIRESKSILYVEGYEPRIVDNRAVSVYYPMAVERTFTEALALIHQNANLVMTRASVTVSYVSNKYWVDGNVWSPSPRDILSQEKEWYVHQKDKSHPAKTGGCLLG